MDIIHESCGGSWKFQLYALFIISFSLFGSSLHQLNIVLLAPPVEYLCKDYNDTRNHCPCQFPEYDRSVFSETVVTNWDLICDRQWLIGVSQIFLQLGILIGSIVFGVLSDKFGRKWMFICGNSLQVLTAISLAFVTDFWVFTFLRFVIGWTIGCSLVVGYTLQMELTTNSKRNLISTLYRIPFVVSYTLLPICGYMLRDWRHLQILLSTPTVVVLLYACLMPESPYWCLATGKTERAIIILKQIARTNNHPITGIEDTVNIYQNERLTNVVKSGTILDLFRSQGIFKNVSLMSLVWSILSFSYFGVVVYVGQLSGDLFINLALLAAITWPGCLISYIFAKFAKRRLTLIITLISLSICMISITVLKIFTDEDSIVTVILACVGDVAAFVAFVVTYLYTAEMFPTSVRSASIGVVSMAARIGSMVGGFVAYMNVFGSWVPPLIFGTVPIVATLACFFLPETKGKDFMTAKCKEDRIR